MNLFMFVGSRQIVGTYEKKSMEKRVSFVEKQGNILANQILSSGIGAYDMTGEVTVEDNRSRELKQIANVIDGRIMVVDSDFQIVADTYEQHCGKYLVTKDIFHAAQGKNVGYRQIGDSAIQTITNIYDSETDSYKGAVLIVASIQDQKEMIEHFYVQRSTLLGIFFLLSVVVCVMITIFLHRTFRGVQKELDTIAAGHQEEGLREEGFREFYTLAGSFNKILNRYKELENTRQEFVSNVSHELKTPITSMKILADSLLLQDNVPVEVYEEFMEDIVHEIDRENQIITDLLDLVKMDKTQADLNIAPVNINELLETIMKRISPIAEKRNITMRFETLRQVTAEVDEGKLSLACTNLIENAVKYNNDGGKVDVSLNADHKFFYIRVKDNGVGIPEDSQEQIFERFYRVDKARSRETGGTGLGLAITRNVILLHKGSIRVHSKEGEGSTFLVRIPLNYVGTRREN